MKKINIEPGAFPFRVIEGPEESRYLTWVRNHSNYLAQRGFVDYLRIVAVLIRGILINFATLLPHLFLAALAVALLYGGMLSDWRDQVVDERAAAVAAGTLGGDQADEAKEATDSGAGELFLTRPVKGDDTWVAWVQNRARTTAPYVLTPIVILLALAYYLLFPMVIRLFKVMTAKRTLQSGRESSVKQRDGYELSFSYSLVAIMAVAALETLPLLLHHFHYLEHGMRDMMSAVAGGSAIMAVSATGKVISKLGKAKLKVAVVLLGILGLVPPLLVILHAGDFVVYSENFETPWWALLVIPGLLFLGSVVAVIVGWGRTSTRELRFLGGIFVLVAAASFALYAVTDYIDTPWKFILVMALEVWAFCWLAVDVNLTSVLGMYRDRLASAYLVGENTDGDVDIEEDIDLTDICLHEAMSVAPYHLVNVTHNLQASKDISIRERNSDFFIFSKRFCGGERTGYCRSESLEQVFPQMDLATAMGISAAAAAPNMGANTSAGLVALMTMLNIRLGYWVPNPGLVTKELVERDLAIKDPADRAAALQRWGAVLPAGEYPNDSSIQGRLEKMVAAANQKPAQRIAHKNLAFNFEEVFAQELEEVHARWVNAYGNPTAVREAHNSRQPSPQHGLIGIGYSGGGIRSATVNMGLTQAFEEAGVFDQADYISSVSGGGYFASSVSTLMRAKTKLYSEIEGDVSIEKGDQALRLRVRGADEEDEPTEAVYSFRPNVRLSDEVKTGKLSAGDPLTNQFVERANLKRRFAWRVRPTALWRELGSRLDEIAPWVNLSDGGHIENLAAIELLRRRCRFVIVGDAAADPKMFFGNLATLLRYARIDLGIEITIDLSEMRLHDPVARLPREDDDPLEVSARTSKPLNSGRQFAIGRIRYPNETTEGYFLYFKSSCVGDEEEIIQQYRNTNPSFPHESTADQFFSEGQFEAYRALGYHMGKAALAFAPGEGADRFRPWFAQGKNVSDFFTDWFQGIEAAVARRRNAHETPATAVREGTDQA